MSRAVYRVNAIQTQVLKAEEDRLITQEAYDDVVKAFQISSGLCGKINERGGDGTLYRVEDGVTLERDDKALIAAAHTSLVYGRVSAALGKEIAESEAGGPSLRKRLAAAGVLFDNAASALHLSQKMFSYCRLSEEVLWTNVCLGDLDYCRFRGIEDTAAIITSRDFVQKAVDAYTAEGRPDSPQAAFAMGHLGRVFLGLQSTDTLMAMLVHQSNMHYTVFRKKGKEWLLRARDMYLRLYQTEDHPGLQVVKRLIAQVEEDEAA
eukprot:TRINITY_DN59348_c0_g1_i5.p1 TRINITY_DN59348_c0_g1~~TRINITY_DN59348_c0_g1_i5.p1  ORF type:complete len:264 (-),score=45.89 TRINITY_DN59348_c0_g1_i5:14-805(-)